MGEFVCNMHEPIAIVLLYMHLIGEDNKLLYLLLVLLKVLEGLILNNFETEIISISS